MSAAGHVTPFPEWRQLLEHYGTSNEPRRITHLEISRLTGIPYGTRMYYHHTAVWKDRMLTERKILVRNDEPNGYYIAPADESPDESKRRARLAARKWRSSMKVLVHARLDEMSESQRTKCVDMMTRVAAMVKLSKDAVREIRALDAPKRPDMPRISPVSEV